MKIAIKLTPDQISEVVSRELMNLYDDMRKDNTLLIGTAWENEAALKSLKHIIEYYTTPTKFEEWMKEE